jgi:hypothetical protein
MAIIVVAQGFTILMICMGSIYGLKPHDHPSTYEEKMSRTKS